VRSKRLQLILIALAFAAPVLLAVALNTPWFRLKPDSTRNYGTLISPVIALADLGLAETGAEQGRGTGVWTLLWLPESSDCTATLDLLRRLRLAEGRELERVQLAYDDRCSQAPIEGQLQLDSAASAAARQRLGASGLLLLDPYGNAMMRYPLDFDGTAVKKDLARLLRYSKAGKA
jgi:hypothetical protein